MQEIWEIIKSSKTQIRQIKIDIEISNKANVRLKGYYKDKEIACYDLTLGKGLYVDIKIPNIKIYGCGKDVYRYVYFMQYTNNKYIKGYQIHHLDYNHCNNSIDNLLYCSAIEHGNYHKFQYKLANIKQGYDQQFTELELKQLLEYNKAQEYYKWLEDNKEYFSINKAREYIKQIRQEIIDKVKPIIEQERIERKHLVEQKKIQNKINAEQERIDKINSGKYNIYNGRLVLKNKPKWTAERRKKTMNTRRERCYSNPTWLNNVKQGQQK